MAIKSFSYSPSTQSFNASAGSQVESLAPNSFNFTNALNKRSLQDNAASIYANGVQKPVNYVEIGGENYLVNGNHRVAMALKFGRSTVPAQRVQLPFMGFKTADEVLAGNGQFSNPFGSSTFRFFFKYHRPPNF